MKGYLWSRGIGFVGILGLFLFLGVPKPSFAVHEGNCNIGDITGDCTINSPHEIGSNVAIEGNLIMTPTGHIKFTGPDPRQLYVKGNLEIQVNGGSKGKISYEGTGTANPGQNGGDLTIIVDGSATVLGEVSVKGGNASPVRNGDGATGGNGGILTFNVCGDFTSSGDITAKGGNGGNSTGPDSTTGGNGGSGGAITINVNGSVTITGKVHAQGGNGGNPNGQNGGSGTITINTAMAAVNTIGADFNPNATINVDQIDPAQCGQPLPEGCSQGFWKNHTAAWQVYSPNQTVGSVFENAPASLAGATLLEALNFGGGSTLDGAKQNLLRQAVAALLNAAHVDVFYPRSLQDIIDEVDTQLGSSTRSAILAVASELDVDNNLGCPLN